MDRPSEAVGTGSAAGVGGIALAEPPHTGGGENISFYSRAIVGSLTRLGTRNRAVFYLLATVALISWPAWLIIAWMAWLVGIPELWQPLAEGRLTFGGMVVSGVVTVALAFLPFAFIGMVLKFNGFVAKLSDARDEANVALARQRLHATEEDALNRLEETDEAGLLPLLRYSRAQLDAYYAMGLAQTKRSFFQALIAMWLGFTILAVGLALYLGPVERLGLQRPSQDFNVLILGSAAIVEFISALFLWVYRSTIGQLTFYYRLQMHSHSSILAFRMAASMANADDAKLAIITSVLDSSMMPERPSVEGGRGLMGLIRPAPTVGASSSPSASSGTP